uniref:Protein kinase domain-containing protein n=1 Tax=Rhodosorus marinus TaxID=101924 RepID=A0A7S3A9U5_9RHOD|mmetsp:Transcript_8429/g.37637  ORF Transcript_8429/g.37637 Transcript_8429/m.37637 type:complete len:525 (+) Transcript_8429:226-1800(+)|eukprot:CAMPEP_0113965206 /NCGR_PEP_ID=MMETSP0011_2-20120614/7613_1 /TAXON_ID=101924 /ORGANISM="Rhodosorus marinus" /LENGTH=524 /DNA_ID=CAMNT_0000977687 /DNA_START=187 /DNA_END=1761 /DNA_ORIENTATION=- /assembly_acc=CAM_ASM_000156
MSNSEGQGRGSGEFLEPVEIPIEEGSSYRDLSADSWVTVETEEDDADQNLFPEVDDDDYKDNELYTSDGNRRVNEMSNLSSVAGKSVLDCLVDVLAGVKVQRKKRLRINTSEQWLWVAGDLQTLQSKTRRKPDAPDSLKLHQCQKLKVDQCELSLELGNRKRATFIFSNEQEAREWLTGLSFLVPTEAKVIANGEQIRNRHLYNPVMDSWRGKLVADRKRVNQYVLLGGIGKGAFGKVKLGLSKEDKKFYAVKIIQQAQRHHFSRDRITREEHAILKKLRHPNIVRHHDVLYDEENDRVIYVVEYMSRGVVLDSKKLEGSKPMSENSVREISRDVVYALEYLQKQNIVHRDIKPDNLLRAGDGTVKLSDFGEAKYYHLRSRDDRGKNLAPGTPAFIAPEMCTAEALMGRPVEDYSADIWSLGATIFYMVYGRAPFVAESVLDIYEAITKESLQFPSSPKVSRNLQDLLSKMLTKEPRARVRLVDIISHPWFEGRIKQKASIKPIRVTDNDIANAIKRATYVVTE